MVALVSLWTETLLYGIYTTLFFQSMYVMLKGINLNAQSRSAKIFICAAALMFLIATAHFSLALHFLLERQGTPDAETPWLPGWHYIAHTSMFVIMLWIFDCLMIYRCYIIWGKRKYIVVAPIILFVACIIVSFLASLSIMQNPTEIKKFKPLLHVTPPLYILQNFTTTGLISFRLVRQHRASRASGIQPSNTRLNLFHVVRIILESAAIYTVFLLITIISLSTGSRTTWILAAMSTPIIGIALTLISFRLHVVAARAREPRTTLFTVAPYVNDSNLTDVEASRSTQSENRLPTVAKNPRPSYAPATR